jgi:hypothetical protein
MSYSNTVRIVVTLTDDEWSVIMAAVHDFHLSQVASKCRLRLIERRGCAARAQPRVIREANSSGHVLRIDGARYGAILRIADA